MKKILAAVLAAALCVGIGIGGTLAWLTAESGEVTNTFTVGDINIDLKEHVYTKSTNSLSETEITTQTTYEFVPGKTLPKDPFVTVKADSEACWLFITVNEANNTATGLSGKIINWTVDAGVWTKLDGYENVWYKQLNATATDKPYNILDNKQVTVNSGVTKAMVDDINDATKPTLTFDAAAIQSEALTKEGGAAVSAAADALALLPQEFLNGCIVSTSAA